MTSPFQKTIDYYLDERMPVEALRIMGLDHPEEAVAADRIQHLLSRCPIQVSAERLTAYVLQTKGQPSREQLVSLLDTGDATVMVESLKELARCGPPLRDDQPIVALLDDANPEIAVSAARAASKCLPKDRVAELAEGRMKTPVGMQLAEKVPALFPQLLQGLLAANTVQQASLSLAELSIGGLGERGPLLRDFLRSHPDLPLAAYSGLGFVSEDWVEEFAPQLLRVLAEITIPGHLRGRALSALKSMGRLTPEVLRARLEDPEYQVRYQCLVELGEPEAMAAALEREDSRDYKQLVLQFFLDHDCRQYSHLVLAQSQEDDKRVKAIYKQIVKAWGLKAPKANNPPPAWKKQGLQDLGALRNYLESTKLKAHAEAICAQALPSRRLLEGQGWSKLGGLPELAAGLSWPEGYRFVAQLDLTEVGLGTGKLFFFVHPEDYVDGDGRVLYAPDGGAEAPGPAYPERRLEARAELSLPGGFTGFARGLGKSLCESYRNFLEQIGLGLDAKAERVGGHANWVQGEMAQLELVLQVDSHPKMGWGDGGRLFFLIEPEARQRGDWGEIVLEFQGG